MEKPIQRYDLTFTLLHWLIALLVVTLFALGCYFAGLPESHPAREFSSQLHISLGLTLAPILAFFLIWRLMQEAPPAPDYVPRWQRHVVSVLYFLLYVCLLLVPLSGYLQLAFGAQPVSFWGPPAPLWGWPDETLSGRFRMTHAISAYLFAALIALHLVIVLLYARKHPGFIHRMMPALHAQRRDLGAIAIADAARGIKKAAGNLRVLGWLAFWIQLGVAVLAGVLLLFAGSGRFVSPDSAGIELGMFWATYGIVALVIAAVFCFRYVRLAKKMLHNQIPRTIVSKTYLQRFLQLGTLLGVGGMMLGITGVGVSISVLIAKVVSQPPGIAITDPTRIIRALDVFVLLANFGVICGHFTGMITSLWLLSRTGRLYPEPAIARHLLPAPAKESSVQPAGD